MLIRSALGPMPSRTDGFTDRFAAMSHRCCLYGLPGRGSLFVLALLAGFGIIDVEKSEGLVLTAKVSSRQPGAQVPQIPRDRWKDCEYNLEVIGCIDQQLPDGLRIVWKDGLSMEYIMIPRTQAGEEDILRDRLGGLWRREVMIQGNVVLTNLGNGNRLLVPLRLTCRPPLKGKVGYCHY